MKKLGVYSVLVVSAFCFLSWLSPLKAYASPVNMDFVGVGGENSGGVFTYPYYFKINGGPEVSLMCVAYQQEIWIPETWQATITAVGIPISIPSGSPVFTLSTLQEEEDAYLDSVVLNPSSSTLSGHDTVAQIIADAQWADWEVGDPALVGHLPSGLDDAGITTEYDAAETFVSSHTTKNDASFYDGYQLYVPVAGTEWPAGDGLPQTFIGPAPTPEPSSLVLLGSGLLAAAGALYRRKRRTA